MSKRERVVLIDGTWLVYRAFFAIPTTFRTKAGLPTNATYGFAAMFRKLFQGRAPDLGAVVFDAPVKTHREERFPEYKAQRPPAPDELKVQFASIDRVVDAMGFRRLRAPGYEGDDLLATLARHAVEAGHDVTLIAGDKDLAQTVVDAHPSGGRVRMHDPMREVTFDEELVRKKWGVPPRAIPDLLALMGDDVDNLPGVQGIGAKGAAALLDAHGSLDGILANLESLKGKQRASLEAARDAVRLFRELATVDSNVPVDALLGARGLEALRLGPPDPATVEALFRELEFASLLGGNASGDAARAPAVDEVTSASAVAEFAQEADAVGLVHEGAAIAIGLAAGDRRIAFDGQRAELAEALVRALAARARPVAVHDWKGLAHTLAARHPHLETALEAMPTFDTRLASFLIDPARCLPHAVDQVCREFIQRVPPSSGAPLDRAGAIAEVVQALVFELVKRLDEAQLTLHLDLVEGPLSRVLFRMERTGIAVDAKDLEAMSVELRARKAALEETIHGLAGHPFNIGSTKQLADVLFDELKLPVIKKTKTGYSTDAEVLEKLATKHPIAEALLRQRELAKLISTYTDVLPACVRPSTGRIHVTYLQTTGVSGRLISTEPDLQRTPVRTPEGERIRRCFRAPPGRSIVCADWSQIELRVLAHFSRDEALLRAFAEGLDLHRQTASVLFGVPAGAVDKAQRNVGKTVNFATVYGQGATALGQILGIPRKEALVHIDRMFTHYAGVRRWLDSTIEDAHATGYVSTILGRRRFIPELSSQNEQDRSAGERIATNTPIQGSAADLCKLAMLRIDRDLPKTAPSARMLLQVHDELLFEVDDAEVESTVRVVRAAMESPMPLSVPLVVDVGVGPSWGEAKA